MTLTHDRPLSHPRACRKAVMSSSCALSQDNHILVWHWPMVRKAHRIRIKAVTEWEPNPVRLVASANVNNPARRGSLHARSSAGAKLRHQVTQQTIGKGWGWSVPFPLQLATSDELLHVKSRYSSLTTDSASSGVHAFEPLIFTVEQELRDGVHFVKFSRGRPHEMLTHIYNDTEQEVLVRQASSGGEERASDVVPAMGSIPFSLDDPWGPRSLELRAGSFLTAASSEARDGEASSGSQGWQISFSLEHIFINRTAQPLAPTPSRASAEVSLEPVAEADIESGAGSRVGLRPSDAAGAPHKGVSIGRRLSQLAGTEREAKDKTKAEALTVRQRSAHAAVPATAPLPCPDLIRGVAQCSVLRTTSHAFCH